MCTPGNESVHMLPPLQTTAHVMMSTSTNNPNNPNNPHGHMHSPAMTPITSNHPLNNPNNPNNTLNNPQNNQIYNSDPSHDHETREAYDASEASRADRERDSGGSLQTRDREREIVRGVRDDVQQRQDDMADISPMNQTNLPINQSYVHSHSQGLALPGQREG